jgi:thiol-disulfide isomerase/thioredoxin
MRAERSIAMALVLFAIAWSGGLRQAHSAEPPRSGQMRQFMPADPVRQVPVLSFTDRSGEEMTIGRFKGKIVLVNLWATWCPPCVKEMPSLDRLQAKLGGDDFAVVAISEDRQGLKIVEPFYEKTGLGHLDIYLDPQSTVSRALQLRGLPTTLILDRDGRELGRLEGSAEWDSADALALLRHYAGPAGKGNMQKASAR